MTLFIALFLQFGFLHAQAQESAPQLPLTLPNGKACWLLIKEIPHNRDYSGTHRFICVDDPNESMHLMSRYVNHGVNGVEHSKEIFYFNSGITLGKEYNFQWQGGPFPLEGSLNSVPPNHGEKEAVIEGATKKLSFLFPGNTSVSGDPDHLDQMKCWIGDNAFDCVIQGEAK